MDDATAIATEIALGQARHWARVCRMAEDHLAWLAFELADADRIGRRIVISQRIKVAVRAGKAARDRCVAWQGVYVDGARAMAAPPESGPRAVAFSWPGDP